jgi:hypothetical protein
VIFNCGKELFGAIPKILRATDEHRWNTDKQKQLFSRLFQCERIAVKAVMFLYL